MLKRTLYQTKFALLNEQLNKLKEIPDFLVMTGFTESEFTIYNRALGDEFTYSINLLNYTVEKLREMQVRIEWQIQNKLIYTIDKEIFFYEEPFWKLIANGDSISIYLAFEDLVKCSEHLLQLINGIQLSKIIIGRKISKNTSLEAVKIISKVANTDVQYQISNYL